MPELYANHLGVVVLAKEGHRGDDDMWKVER